MLSALIQSRLRYPAMHLAAQLVNQRSVQHGPLVLVSEPRKFHTPTIDRDRTEQEITAKENVTATAAKNNLVFIPFKFALNV